MGNPDDIDERGDIYALGAILYYILSGNAPYTGASAKEVLERLLANSPRHFSGVRVARTLIRARFHSSRKQPKSRGVVHRFQKTSLTPAKKQ